MPVGAVLRWIYDEDGDDTYSLMVRLTEAEAQRIFDSDPRSGMLESVRRDLHWRGGLITVTNGEGVPVRSWRYIIQGDTTEEEFVRDLMNPPPDVFNALRSEQRRDLEFVAPILAGAIAG